MKEERRGGGAFNLRLTYSIFVYNFYVTKSPEKNEPPRDGHCVFYCSSKVILYKIRRYRLLLCQSATEQAAFMRPLFIV